MAKVSKISWTNGTLNFWEGCEKVSPGCKNCYAEERDLRFHNGEHWGEGAPRRLSKSALLECRRFNKAAAEGRFTRCLSCGVSRWRGDDCCGSEAGTPARPIMFVMSLGDIGDEAVEPQWLADALVEILKSDSMDFMLLTKRITTFRQTIQRATACMSPHWRERVLDWMEGHSLPPNVAVGTSIESAPYALARLEALAAFPTVRRFVSAEPLLSGGWAQMLNRFADKIHLVIVGGESGQKARPMHPMWASELEIICDHLAIPYHFKQWGTWAPWLIVEPDWTLPVGGNFLNCFENGTVKAFDPAVGKMPGAAMVWRAGKGKSGHACEPNGRTRTETLQFPSQPWKCDWWRLTGHPLDLHSDRRFASLAFLQEFMRANPWDGASGKPCPPPNFGAELV